MRHDRKSRCEVMGAATVRGSDRMRRVETARFWSDATGVAALSEPNAIRFIRSRRRDLLLPFRTNNLVRTMALNGTRAFDHAERWRQLVGLH